MQFVETLNDYGRPAWIIAMILGFIIWWPIGLGVLAYMIWSGGMGCGWKREWKDSELGREVRRWSRGMSPLRPTGNAAFDGYREETLARLEDEAKEFQSFLQRLRKARDKAEFDQFMTERRDGTAPTVV
jgi:hypothetical protein